MIKILFGVSDTSECRKAIDTVAKLFKNRGDVELTLLHVSSDTTLLTEAGIIDYTALAEGDGTTNDILDEFEQAFCNRSFECKKVLRNGNPLDTLLDIASEYDLLVIGSSEGSAIKRFFNSHQNSFVNSSPIPILVSK